MRGMMGAGLGLLLMGASSAPEPATMHLVLTGLRSDKGMVRLCIWPQGRNFPDCAKGENVRRLEGAAASTVRIDVPDLAPGRYAVSVIHDENDNRKLDKNFIGVPTEGVGFSRNPQINFGPPSFEKAAVEAQGEVTTEIRMKYYF